MPSGKEEYRDIYNRPHHVSSKRPQMSRLNRAAQFSPFAALTGYDDLVAESARVTDEKHELGEFELEQLNSRIQYLRDHLSEEPEVNITYFQADERKAGGSYIVFTGTVKKIDEYSKSLLLSNDKAILFEDICSIEAPCFVEEIM